MTDDTRECRCHPADDDSGHCGGTMPTPGTDIRWATVTCARCGETGQCTPWSDYYETHLWDGDGRVCEACFHTLIGPAIREANERP